MRRHAKAPSAGPTQATGSSRGLFRRALATRAVSHGSKGSGAPAAKLLGLIAVSLLALFATAAPASAAPPTVTTPVVSNISYTSAHVEGKLTSTTDASSFNFTAYAFQYSTDETTWTTLFNSNPSSPIGDGAFTGKEVEANIEGLKGGTQYFVRIVAQNGFFVADPPEAVSPLPNPSFTTLPVDPPVIIATDDASDVFSTSATASGIVERPSANTDPAFDISACRFEYVTDTQFVANEGNGNPGFTGAGTQPCAESIDNAPEAETNVTAHLTGLEPATTYHLRLAAENAAPGVATKDAANFTTAAKVAAPTIITTDEATDVSYGTAKATGEVERPAGADPALNVECRFEYITDDQYKANELAAVPLFEGATPIGCAENPITADTVGIDGKQKVSAELTGLQSKSGVTYHLRLVAENAGGTDAKDAPDTFTTLAGGDTTTSIDPPVMGYTTAQVSGTISRGALNENEFVNPYFEYAEAGTGNWSGIEKAGLGFLPAGTGPFSRSFKFTGLTPDTEYDFRLNYQLEGVPPENPGPILTAKTRHLEAPTATLDPVTVFTGTTAHFTGTVDTHAPAGPFDDIAKAGYKTNWHIECTPSCPGPGGAPYSGMVQAEEGSKSISVDATDLDPQTDYEVELVAQNELYTGGSTQTFDTDKIPPSVKQTAGASDGKGGYILQGTVDPNNETVTDCKFEWGPDANQFAFSADCSPLPSPRGEVQIVTLKHISAGSFRLSFRGQTTEDIPWDAPASVVQTQLESLSSIGPAGVSVSDQFGGYRVVFAGSLAGTDLEELDAESGIPPLTGGNPDFVDIAVTTIIDGGNNSPITVEAHLTGLNPGVGYHSQLVVTYGTDLQEDSGEPLEFKATLTSKEPCPANEQLRVENNSLALPECRAYEMVTPVGKEGFGTALETFDGGDRVAYASGAGNIAKSGQGSAAKLNQYVAERTASGWETISNLNGSSGSLRDGPSYVDSNFGNTTLRAYSPDLRSSIWDFHRQGQPASHTSFLHLRSPDGTFALIGSMLGVIERAKVVVSDDLSHAVSETGPTEWGTGVYEYVVGTGMDQPRRVDLDNFGAPISTCTMTGFGGLANALNQSVSRDGDTIVNLVAGGCGGANPPANELWARVNGTTAVDVSASHCTRPDCNAPANSTFQATTPDGSRVFFTTTQQLVNADTDQTNDIYACDLPSGNPAPTAERANHCTAFRQVSGAQTGAAVESVNATSEGGATVFFTAEGKLADNEDALKVEAVAGDHNLYVWRADAAHPDGRTTFVARLDSNDLHQDAQTTPDGRYLVFTTASQLLETDTDTARDVYRYDIDSGDLDRVSTNVFGVAGSGDGFDALIPAEKDPEEAFPGKVVQPAVSDDGAKIVFTTTEALSPADGNAEPDVYLWTPARVSLISTGSSGSAPKDHLGEVDNPKVAIDPSGENIYFESAQALTPADPDDVTDIYDARIGGGFSFAPPPICSGEKCQPDVTLPSPNPPSPANTPNGDGNVKPLKPCPKGKVRKKNGKCVPKHKKHHKKTHKKAGHNRGGSK